MVEDKSGAPLLVQCEHPLAPGRMFGDPGHYLGKKRLRESDIKPSKRRLAYKLINLSFLSPWTIS